MAYHVDEVILHFGVRHVELGHVTEVRECLVVRRARRFLCLLRGVDGRERPVVEPIPVPVL